MITKQRRRDESPPCLAQPPAGQDGEHLLDTNEDLGVDIRLRVGLHACRIVCVDKVVPRHVESRHDAHPRLIYAEGEIVHFELDHHRYALVSDQAPIEVPNGRSARAVEPPDDLRDLLTNREMQIVQLICLGYLTKQVADRLHLSEFTVRSYLKTIYCKLGVRSRAAMVFRYAQAFSLDARGA
jgi:DNA-binding CsgD family transcriptional regulator